MIRLQWLSCAAGKRGTLNRERGKKEREDSDSGGRRAGGEWEGLSLERLSVGLRHRAAYCNTTRMIVPGASLRGPCWDMGTAEVP